MFLDKKHIIGLIFSILMTFSVLGQTQELLLPIDTNSFFNPREMTFEIAPTISATSLGMAFTSKSARVYGYSLETEYWTSLNMGTGLEIGSYDYRTVKLIGPVDHIAIMEDLRFIPFPNDILLKRLSVGGKIGAETYFLDGSKDIEFGPSLEWTLVKGSKTQKGVRIAFDIEQHVRSNPKENGITAKIALKIF